MESGGDRCLQTTLLVLQTSAACLTKNFYSMISDGENRFRSLDIQRETLKEKKFRRDLVEMSDS